MTVAPSRSRFVRAAAGAFLAVTVLVTVAAATGNRLVAASSAHVSAIGAPVTVGTKGNEPIVKVAPDGTVYISALEYLYSSTDGGASWNLTPGTLYNNPPGNGGVNLNTDSSIDVDPNGRLYFTFDWPYAGTTAVCVSDTKATSFSCNTTVTPGGTDRMWLVAPSTSASYLVTNIGLYQTLFFTSADRGATWTGPKQSTTAALNPDTGPLLKSPKNGLIFQPYVNNNTNLTATTNLASGPLGFHVFDPSAMTPISAELTTPLNAPNALPSAGFTSDGTLYLVSEGARIGGQPGYQLTLARSTDQGANWMTLPPLPGTSTGTQSFTAVATGVPGHVGVLYYNTAAGGDPTADPAAVWDAMWAESINADSMNPTWTVQTIDPSIHTGSVCSTAGCMGDQRYSGDFISATFDANDLPRLTWMKDLDTSGTKTQVRYAAAASLSAATPDLPAAPLAILAAAGLVLAVRRGRTMVRRTRE